MGSTGRRGLSLWAHVGPPSRAQSRAEHGTQGSEEEKDRCRSQASQESGKTQSLPPGTVPFLTDIVTKQQKGQEAD